jgi:Raf kinase inhibitor-like YbhB/YbcL family protein
MTMTKILIITLIVISLTTNAIASARFSLSSGILINQGSIPSLYTCDSKDISPQLAWNNAPAKTRSYAISLSDIDAPGGIFYHWIIYNLPKQTQTLAEAVTELPKQAKIAKNSWGNPKYNGPCPPKGMAHKYIFTIYALDNILELEENSDSYTVITAIQNHSLAKANLNMHYSRWNS